MSVILPSLPRSDSKTRFMTRLGLDMRNVHHLLIYNLMKSEASSGRRRIIATLDAQARNAIGAENSSTASAEYYSTSQIDGQTMNAEISRIFETAQPSTRTMYELAEDPNRPEEPNWIIRWMLWHVFRYRDGRQKFPPERSPDTASEPVLFEDDEDGGGDPAPVARSESEGTWRDRQVSSTNAAAAPRLYDPVRDQWNS